MAWCLGALAPRLKDRPSSFPTQPRFPTGELLWVNARSGRASLLQGVSAGSRRSPRAVAVDQGSNDRSSSFPANSAFLPGELREREVGLRIALQGVSAGLRRQPRVSRLIQGSNDRSSSFPTNGVLPLADCREYGVSLCVCHIGVYRQAYLARRE
jgi:hypothetical protein